MLLSSVYPPTVLLSLLLHYFRETQTLETDVSFSMLFRIYLLQLSRPASQQKRWTPDVLLVLTFTLALLLINPTYVFNYSCRLN